MWMDPRGIAGLDFGSTAVERQAALEAWKTTRADWCRKLHVSI